MSDQRDLLAAIRQHPDEDTPRLMYADALDEQDAEYVDCPKCEGRGTYKATDDVHGLCRMNCRNCGGDGAEYRKSKQHGSGKIRDNTLRALAELTRIGVELAKWVHVKGAVEDVFTDGVDWEFTSTGKLGKLHDRQRALLANNPTLRPECPVCRGTGDKPYEADSQDDRCRFCWTDYPKNGPCGRTGTYERGMLSLAVPSLTTLWERGTQYDETTLTAWDTGNWQLTDYGQMLRDRYPWVVSVDVGDRVPLQDSRWNRWGWYTRSGEMFSHGLPQEVFDMLPGGGEDISASGDSRWRWYDTPERARQALARAVAEALHGTLTASETQPGGR